MLKIGIILQARMGSSRLPGKILMEIGSKPLLAHIFHRLQFLKHEATTVLATSDLKQDDIVEKYCLQQNVECFRGSEQNVLERYYHCARKYRFDHIIRVTGDNPFPDIEELDNLIDLHLQTKSDYSNSFDMLPVGIGLEIFSFAALEKSYHEGKEPHHVEHVNEYILEHPELFKTSILDVPASKKHPEIRLTVDTPEDYQKACYVATHSSQEYISTEEAIALCLEYA